MIEQPTIWYIRGRRFRFDRQLHRIMVARRKYA